MFVYLGNTFKCLNIEVHLGRSVKIIDGLSLVDYAKVDKYKVNIFVKDKFWNTML